MKLRDYQQACVDEIEAEMVFGSDKIMVELATGGGKSLIISTLCKMFHDKKIFVLVNISKLITQISEHLTEVGVSHSILKAGTDEHYDEDAQVQLVMEQTYHARKDSLSIHADVLIRDEHHIGWDGDRFKEIVKEKTPETVIGFSATPYDQSGVAIPGYENIMCANTATLTEKGFLTPADTYVASFTKDISFDDIGASGDYSKSELDGVINNDSYNQSVVDAYKSLPEQPRKTICFVSGIEHCDALTDKFIENGFKAKSVHSKNKNDATFSDGLLDDVEIIISVSKLAIGFDDPSIDTAILCRPTKVKGLYYQMVGRVLRLYEGQDRVTILDCAKSTMEHGFYNETYKAPTDKKEARELQKEMRHDIIDYMMKQEDAGISEIVTLSGVEATKYKLESDSSLEGLKARFDMSMDVVEVIELAFKINELIRGQKFSDKNTKWVLSKVQPYIEEEGGSLKAIKTRTRNILMQGKKLASLYYFVDWLKEQRGW